MSGSARQRVAVSLLSAFAMLVPVGSMIGGLPAAQADTVTGQYQSLSLSTGDTSTVSPGDPFMVDVGLSCHHSAASGGCGTTTVAITLPNGVVPADSFGGAGGSSVSVTDNADGTTTVTLTWPSFSMNDNTIFSLPVHLTDGLPYSANGTDDVISATLTTATEPDDALTATTSVTLSVPQEADISAYGNSTWTCDAPSDTCQNTGSGPIATDKSGADTTFTVGATSGANTASDMFFNMPSTANPGTGNARVLDSYNLTSLAFSDNPAGATITLSTPTPVVVVIPAGVTSQTAVMALVNAALTGAGATLDQVVGYSIKFNLVPVGGHVQVLTGLQLRDKDRAGVDLTLPQTVVAQTDISVSTPDGSATSQTQPQVTGQVNAASLALAAAKKWQTQSGDQLSVLGSGEAATATIKVANISQSAVQSLTVSEPSSAVVDQDAQVAAASENTFNYEAMTGVPVIDHFPAGATEAQVTYVYGWGDDRVVGSTQTVAPGGPVLAPSAVDPSLTYGGHSVGLADVYGVVITFTGTITSCPLTPASPGGSAINYLSSYDTCAATITIPTALRDTALSGGAIPVPSDTSTTPITNIVHVTSHGNENANGSYMTVSVSDTVNPGDGDQNIIGIVIPEYQVSAAKTIGAPYIGYVLNGTAGAGDSFDTTLPVDEQTYATHQLTLSGGSTYTGNAGAITDLNFGPTSFTFSDPSSIQQGGNYFDGLGSTTTKNFWNDVELTQLPIGVNSPTVTCDGSIGAAIDTSTSYVLVADQVPNATGVTQISLADLTSAVDPAQIVGLVYTIVPTGGATHFGVNTQCSIDTGAVQFRTAQVVGGAPVEPPIDGANPGMLQEMNILDVRSNDAATNSSARYRSTNQAPMFLVDEVVSGEAGGAFVGYKGYAPNAQAYGMEGQGQATSFVIAAGVPTNAVQSINITDGPCPSGNCADNSSLDIFALTGISGARMGPDQTMTIRLLDQDGNLVYVGTASAPTGSADPDDALSAGFQTTEQTDQAITWRNSGGSVVTPDAATLATVAQINVSVVRTSTGELIPQFSIARVSVNVALRSNRLVEGTLIQGGAAPGTGFVYQNRASICTTALDEAPVCGDYSADFTVFSPPMVAGTARIQWDTGQAGVLPASTGTLSSITLAAYNDSAIDYGQHCPDGTAPADVWACAGTDRLDVGVSTLEASVGRSTLTSNQPNQNPFALVDFQALTSITWPSTVHGGPVSATITYTYADGTTAQGTAVSTSADLSGAQPPTDDPAHPTSDIVGVGVTFDAGSDFITTHDASDMGTYSMATAQSAITFMTSLRNSVRPGYEEDFVSGDPDTLTGGDLIVGPLTSDPQVAKAWVSWAASVRNADGATRVSAAIFDVDDTTVNIEGQQGGVSIDKTTGATGLYRDLLPSTTFTLTAGVNGNLSVDSLRMADEGCLIDSATWPSTANPLGSTPAGCTTQPGSMYDAFNATGLTITQFPTTFGTASPDDTLAVTVWLLTSNGWYKYSSADNGIYFASDQSTPWTLTDAMLANAVGPTVGSPAITWADVVGWRLQLDGRDNTGLGVPARIVSDVQGGAGRLATQGELVVELDATLREWTRLDDTVRAPDDDTTAGSSWNGTGWVVPNTADAATYLATLHRIDSVGQVQADVTLLPGDPSPLVDKQVVNDLGHWVKLAELAPGNWDDFMLTIGNTGEGANGSLLDVVLTDQLPDGLVYNSSGFGHQWAVFSAPAHVTQAMLDDIEFTYDPDAGTMTWVLPHSIVLAVGESITLRVPLQMADGTALNTMLNNWVIGTGHAMITSDQTNCKDPSLAGLDPTTTDIPDVCKGQSTVVALGDTGVRDEKYVSNTTADRGQITGEGEQCDASTMAPWDTVTGSAFYRDPCWVETWPGDVVTYRLKLINRGNNPLDQLRFVDALPTEGDGDSLPPDPRGSQFTPIYLPGSLHLVDDATIDDPNFRQGSSLQSSFWYTSNTQPCTGIDWAAGSTVLTCGDSWSSDEPSSVGSFKGSVLFSDNEPLQGGQYIIVEFQMAVPAGVGPGKIAVNDVAVSGHSANPNTNWLPAYLSAPATIVTRTPPEHHDTNVPGGGSLAGDDGMAGGLVGLLMSLAGGAVLIRRRRNS